jgi:hypothetical protein
LPLIGHLSAAMEAEAKERRAMERSVFIMMIRLEFNLVSKISAVHAEITLFNLGDSCLIVNDLFASFC